MKRVKCYGRVKKSVALEKPVVKDFFGEEDYKTSLWDFDSLKKDDKEKESKPVKRAGRKKMSSQRYFFPSSPDMFTSSSCDSKIKLTNKKGQRAKKEKNNKNIPESNKINLRKRLRDKNNEIDIYDAEIQPKWSEIEDHDLCLETYKRYESKNVSVKCISRIQDYDNLIKLTNKKGQRAKKENNNKNIPESNKINLRKRLRDKNNEIDIYDAEIQPKWSEIEEHDLCLETYKRYESKNVSVKCISRIQDYDNLSADKENQPLDVIILSSSPKLKDNVLSRKSSRIKHKRNLKSSSILFDSTNHVESFHADEVSLEKQNLVISHSKESESLSPAFDNYLALCQNLIKSKQQSLRFSSSPEPYVSRKISNFLENSISIKDSQRLNHSKQHSSELNASSEPLCVNEKISNLFENSTSMKASQNLDTSNKQASELSTSPEALLCKKISNSLEKSINVKNFQLLNNSKNESLELGVNSEPLCFLKQTSNLLENSISMDSSQHLINSEQHSLQISSNPEARVSKKISSLFENNISTENSKHSINSKQQSSELSAYSEPLCANGKISKVFKNSISMKNSKNLNDSRQQSSELSTCSKVLCDDKEISNLFENSRSMKNSKCSMNRKHQSSELGACSELLSIDKKISKSFKNSTSMKDSEHLINSKQSSELSTGSEKPLCAKENICNSFGNNTSIKNSEHLVNGKHSSEVSTRSEVLCVDKKNSIMFGSNSLRTSHSPILSVEVENISSHSSVHLNVDTKEEHMHKHSEDTFSNSMNVQNACLLLPGEEQNAFNVNHTAEKSKNNLQSPISFPMSPVHLDIAEQENNKNSGDYCVDRSKTNVMTSTPFPKFKLAEDSNASELEVIASSGKGLVNNEQISGIIQVSGEKRQKHLTRSSDSLSMLRVDLFQKSCLNLKAIVNGSNYTLSQYNISNLFPSSKSSHSLCNDHVIDSSAANVSRHSTSKMAIQNVSVTTQTKHEIAEAKAKLLKLCKQDSVVQFSEVFKWSSLNVKKIGEGTYGEVFIITKGKTSTVVKIIPVSEEIGDDSFQGLQNVLSEVKIAQSLSGLRNKKINQTKNFNKLKSAHLVMGQYPDVLINAWDSFSEAKSTYNDRPDFFSEAQLFVILEQEYGGKDMSNFVLRHAVEAESVFKQIAISLAIAEEEFLFEHRDLHLGNILIQRNRSKKISYVLRGKPFSIESHGLLVTIIDFTLSRLCETEYVYYNNLADDESLFNQSGDYQFEIYKAMKEHLGNKWHECGLYSNVLWLNFLCVKLKSFPYSRPSSAKHTKALKQLESMEKQLSYCNSATDCLSQCKIVTLPDTNGNRDTRLSSNSILVSRNSFQKSKASIIA